MTLALVLHVSFVPRPQKRHRYSRGRMYDPSSADKRHFLTQCLRTQSPSSHLYSCALACHLEFTFVRPKSHVTSKGALRKSAPAQLVAKPDVDNLAKFVLDALNGTYYKDDSQVCQLFVHKRYGAENSVLVKLTKS